MKRQPIPDDHPYRSFLVPYVRNDPDPRIPQDLIRYIEFRQPGLTTRDIAKLDEIEWFTFHTFTKGLIEFAIPGLRPQKNSEVRYVKRFNRKPYWKMIDDFLERLPNDFPPDQIGRRFLPGYRLTSTQDERFYPIQYNGNLKAWHKLVLDNATHFSTLAGYFEAGRFVISDGRKLEFADMQVDSVTRNKVPPDF